MVLFFSPTVFDDVCVCQAMNISVTTLKRLCRRHGVKRWPHRQISGINRAMAHLEFQQDQAGRRVDRAGGARLTSQVSDQMQELLRRRRVMIEVRVLQSVCRLINNRTAFY